VILTCGYVTSLALAADTAAMLARAPCLLVFILGPLVAAGLATAVTPAAGLWLCVALYAVAATGFATASAVRAATRRRDVERTRAGALASPGIRTIVLVSTVAAVSFGAIEVALPAFSEAEDSRAAAGPLITLWALGSVLGGLDYGSRTWRAPVGRRMTTLMGLLALGTAPITFAWSIPAMGALLVVTGLALAPLDHAILARGPARPAGNHDRGVLVAHRRDRDRLRGGLRARGGAHPARGGPLGAGERRDCARGGFPGRRRPPPDTQPGG
jgi:hypothetical protein